MQKGGQKDEISSFGIHCICISPDVVWHALGVDLTLTTGGRVTVELVSSDAAFHNTLSLVSPAAAIAQAQDGTVLTGCSLESTGFGTDSFDLSIQSPHRSPETVNYILHTFAS